MSESPPFLTPANISERFRGYLPVIIDVETAGFNAQTDALLEVAAVTLRMDEAGMIHIDESIECHLTPFEGANIEQAALDFTGIDLENRSSPCIDEPQAMNDVFQVIRKAVKQAHCKRAILVGHNAHFDLGFINAAAERCTIKRNPFHPFSSFDTATLSGLAYGHTVLAKTCQIAGIEFSNKQAHNAHYDAIKTAELFCKIVNRWHQLGGWPIFSEEDA